VDGGPGEPSLDSALGLHETGAGWALAALALGAVTSTAVIEAGGRAAAAAGPVAGADTAAGAVAGDPVTAGA